MPNIKKVVKNEIEHLSFGSDIVYHRDCTFKENHLSIIDEVELIMIIEDIFSIEISEEESDKLTTPRDLEKLIRDKLKNV